VHVPARLDAAVGTERRTVSGTAELQDAAGMRDAEYLMVRGRRAMTTTEE
jgi:hypothetical protein